MKHMEALIMQNIEKVFIAVIIVGHGGSVVGSVPCVRKVSGSNPTSYLVGTLGKSFTHSCLLRFIGLTPVDAVSTL